MAILTILWLSGDCRFSCFSNVSYVVDLSRVTKRRARSLIFSSLAQPLLPWMPRLWAVIKMRCNESTIYIYPQFKRQYFLQTIENSNLLTNFTTDFTNLSLKLKLIIDRDAKESHFVLNRDNGSFTGQHGISLDPSESNCLIFWMISFHLIEFIPLFNSFQIGIYGMFNLVDIFRRLKELSTSLIPYIYALKLFPVVCCYKWQKRI